MSCDVGEVTEGLENEQSFTYVTAYSPIVPLLHLRHSSFSNHSFDSPTSQALHLIHLASRPCRAIRHMNKCGVLDGIIMLPKR